MSPTDRDRSPSDLLYTTPQPLSTFPPRPRPSQVGGLVEHRWRGGWNEVQGRGSRNAWIGIQLLKFRVEFLFKFRYFCISSQPVGSSKDLKSSVSVYCDRVCAGRTWTGRGRVQVNKAGASARSSNQAFSSVKFQVFILQCQEIQSHRMQQLYFEKPREIS